MSGILIRNVQRETFNSQRSTIWGQTRCLGERTFDPADLTQRRSGGASRLRSPDMGTDTMSDIPIMNIQRLTFNSQLLTG